MILQANLNHFNSLAIGQPIQALNNRLIDCSRMINTNQKNRSFFLVGNKDFFDIKRQSIRCFFVATLIFRHVREDFIDITTYKLMRRKIHCIGKNLKKGFCQSIKRESKEFKGIIKKEFGARIKQIPPISGIKLKDYFLFDLANFSRQASLTHALKLPFPAVKTICSNKSSSKRICFVVLLERSKDFLSFLSCIGSYQYVKLILKGSYHYISDYLEKAMPRSGGTLSRHLPQPLNKVMIEDFDYLSNNPRDANSLRIILFIQPASDSSPSSFCAFSMARRNSGSNLNWNGGLPRLFSFMCVDTPITWMLMYLRVMTCYYHMIKKTMPRSGGTLSRHLPQPLNKVMIMDKRYDSTPLRAEQSKLFKFYDLSIAQVVKTTATTERQARKNLGKQYLVFIARIRLYPIVERSQNWGGYSHEQ